MSAATQAPRLHSSAPDVSVVVGVRDGEARLEAALRSILAQRGVRLELVVVDDGSTDRTPEILAAFAAQDERVRVFRQQAHGLTAALIRGCGEARGRFIARQDADEVSHPDRLRRQLDAFAAHPELALVSCWTEQLAPRGETLRVERGRGGTADRPVPMFERDGGGALRVVAGPSQHGSAMFPAELYQRVGGYRAAFGVAQDWDLWLRLAQHGPFLMVGAALLTTNLDVRSLSFAVRDVQMALGAAATEALARRLAGASDADCLERAESLSRQLDAARGRRRRRTEALGLYHIGEGLRRQRHPASLSYLGSALRRYPFLLRAWVRAGQAVLTTTRNSPDR